MHSELHVNLYVAGAPNGATEPVHVELTRDGLYRVLYSPGLVEGIAAGDLIRLVGEDGRFEVVERGGNVSFTVSANPIDELRAHLVRELAALGGVCDGSITNAAVFPVPVRVGFAAIERVINEAMAAHPNADGWWYGNVYGEDGKPLEWWTSFLKR
jgi:hypothetical protein